MKCGLKFPGEFNKLVAGMGNLRVKKNIKLRVGNLRVDFAGSLINNL